MRTLCLLLLIGLSAFASLGCRKPTVPPALVRTTVLVVDPNTSATNRFGVIALVAELSLNATQAERWVICLGDTVLLDFRGAVVPGTQPTPTTRDQARAVARQKLVSDGFAARTPITNHVQGCITSVAQGYAGEPGLRMVLWSPGDSFDGITAMELLGASAKSLAQNLATLGSIPELGPIQKLVWVSATVASADEVERTTRLWREIALAGRWESSHFEIRSTRNLSGLIRELSAPPTTSPVTTPSN